MTANTELQELTLTDLRLEGSHVWMRGERDAMNDETLLPRASSAYEIVRIDQRGDLPYTDHADWVPLRSGTFKLFDSRIACWTITLGTLGSSSLWVWGDGDGPPHRKDSLNEWYEHYPRTQQHYRPNFASSINVLRGLERNLIAGVFRQPGIVEFDDIFVTLS